LTAKDISTVKITTTLKGGSTARGLFDAAAIRSGPVEYRGELRVDADERPLYIGSVTRAAPFSEGVWVDARNGLQLEEKRLAGFAHAGMTAPELVWSMGRLAGFADDHLKISGLRRLPDRFEVIMPVRGVALAEDLDLGPMAITVDAGRISAAMGFINDGEELQRTFLASGAWASTWADADLILEAEGYGSTLIQGVMDRVALEAQYSLAFAPNGDIPAFDRDALFADPTVEPLALVLASRTSRRWLRTRTDVPYAPPISDRRVRLRTPSPGSDRRFDEALRAWRRAVRATEPIDAVGALWESIEFYAAKAPKPPAVFSKDDRGRVRNALTKLGLTGPQLERIPAMLEAANQPPLLVRLRNAMERDEVPFSDEEIEVLSRLREHRNDFVHGRTRADPASNDLELAKALVNRMLAFRVGSA
jgi:hypothetical protein